MFLEVAIESAKKAAKVLKENQYSSLQVELKGEIDLVTRMDKESEKIITDHIRKHFPSHKIVSEEGTKIEGKKYVWYIDPLDGTTNYAYGLPWYGVSIGLMEEGVPLVGVIINPANGDLFYAKRGEGSYYNSVKICVSSRKTVNESLLATGFPYYVRKIPQRVISNLKKFLVYSRGVRRFGAASLDLAYVALGRYDGFWEEGLKPWDTAAGILLVTEAGGKISNYKGDKYSIFSDTIVASNGFIHQEMIDILQKEDY